MIWVKIAEMASPESDPFDSAMARRITSASRVGTKTGSPLADFS